MEELNFGHEHATQLIAWTRECDDGIRKSRRKPRAKFQHLLHAACDVAHRFRQIDSAARCRSTDSIRQLGRFFSPTTAHKHAHFNTYLNRLLLFNSSLFIEQLFLVFRQRFGDFSALVNAGGAWSQLYKRT